MPLSSLNFSSSLFYKPNSQFLLRNPILFYKPNSLFLRNPISYKFKIKCCIESSNKIKLEIPKIQNSGSEIFNKNSILKALRIGIITVLAWSLSPVICGGRRHNLAMAQERCYCGYHRYCVDNMEPIVPMTPKVILLVFVGMIVSFYFILRLILKAKEKREAKKKQNSARVLMLQACFNSTELGVYIVA